MLKPTIYYTKFEEYQKVLNNISGIYTDLDMGQYILVKFEKLEDAVYFKLRFEYV